MKIRFVLFLFFGFLVGTCKKNIQESTVKATSVGAADFGPDLCEKASSASINSVLGSAECKYSCETCLGYVPHDYEFYFKQFSGLVWAEWWGVWGLNWLVTLSKTLQKPQILSSIKAANIGTCWTVLIITLVKANNYLSSFSEKDASYLDQDGIARLSCSIIYSMSACTAATKFPPIAAALKPFSAQITAAMAACSIGEYLGNKIVCNAAQKTCLNAIHNANPISRGNSCCCERSEKSWTIEKEHDCKDSGGKIKAGTCGFGLPEKAKDCQII